MVQPDPLRVIQVGAGGMGRTWLAALAGASDVQLVGLVDLDLARAADAARATGHLRVPVARTLAQLAGTSPQAVVDVTVPGAHHAVNSQALRAGLPVLCEKPLAPTVSEGLASIAVAELSGRLLVVSQSRRYWRQLDAFRRQVAQLGRISTVTCEFFRAPHFGGFREEMAHPLLVDMAIHQFDLARLLIGSDPVGVSCESYNPPWSWFAGDAAAVASFTFPGGVRFGFTGSWVAAGEETSWNGRWRVSGERGSAVWDGDAAPVATVEGQRLPAEPGTGGEQIEGSLAEFVTAVRGGPVPATAAHRNVLSLAMVEAAIASAGSGGRVLLAEVLESAHVEAVRAEQDHEVRAVLQSWPSVQQALGLGVGQPG